MSSKAFYWLFHSQPIVKKEKGTTNILISSAALIWILTSHVTRHVYNVSGLSFYW